MVPTYFRRCSGIECFNGHCGFALLNSDIVVMAGLVPAIHAFSVRKKARRGCPEQVRA
jgi:hypothetical protein